MGDIEIFKNVGTWDASDKEKSIKLRIEKTISERPGNNWSSAEVTYNYYFPDFYFTVEVSERLIDKECLSLKTAEKIIYSIETKDEAFEIAELFWRARCHVCA